MIKGMVFAERYKLVDFLGQGGMSLVYRAVDIRTGHNVAIKILKSEYNEDAEFLERFQREAHAAGRMSHHNIVNLLDVGTEGEFRYLVLEYISGNTLKDIIKEKGALNPNTAIQITIRILSALQHAHDNGIIHRDIKPQNVLVNTHGHIKVADFGIARITNTKTISKKDVVIGSVHYSSPEQARGSVVEATSDIYSTGIVLYEMLTGRVPFTGDNPVTVAMHQVNALPPPIRELNPAIPPAIAAVVMKALEKSPQRRFQSAREMADALLKAKEGILIDTAPPAEGKPARGKDNRTEPDIKSATALPSAHFGVRTKAQGQGSTTNRKRRVTLISTILGACLLMTAIVFGTIAIYRIIITSTSAPDIVGMTLEEAGVAVGRADLLLEYTQVNHDTIPADTIIDQTPQADTTMKKGDSIVATVSIGPVTMQMPGLTGLMRDEAVEKLKDRGLNAIVFKTPSTQPVDTVIAQKPDKDQPYVAGQEIELTLSGGSVIIPELTGMSMQNAVFYLEQNALKIGDILMQSTDDENETGVVQTQSPTSGTNAILDTSVSLTIGVPATMYNAIITVPIPESAQSAALRITLSVNGEEVEAYQGTTQSGKAYTAICMLSTAEQGPYPCFIYLDGELLLQQEVTLR